MDVLLQPLTARNDLGRVCIAAAIAGILSHALYFIRGFHDARALGIIAVHTAAYVVLCAFTMAQRGISGGFLVSSAVFGSYLIALFTSIVTYRVFFHPLRHFPGPLAAKITKLHSLYTAVNGQIHIEQNKLLRKYGSIVRMAPNELFIVSSDAVTKIHASKSGCRKRSTGMYDVLNYKGESNLVSMVHHEDHRWRRQVWERAMTKKEIDNYEPRTREVVHQWLQKLASSRGQPIDTSLFSLLITFDNMGKVGYSHDFNTIETGKENRMLHLLEVTFGQVAALGELCWPLALLQSLNVGGESAEFEQLARTLADERAKHDTGASQDIFKHFLEDFRSPKPKAFFNQNILYADAALILIGATDTVAVALSYAFFYLAKNLDAQEKLYDAVAEVRGKSLPGELTNADLSGIEYLDAIINETLRLENPVANNAARMTPSEGIVVDGVYIPGGVCLRVPGYAMQRSKSPLTPFRSPSPKPHAQANYYSLVLGSKAFVRPDEFIPERWTTRADLVIDRTAFFPFLAGPYNCVGKRLAMMVLRLVLSYTALHYRFQYAPGEDGTAIHKQAKDNLILKAGPLKLVFTKRE
ncbi:Tryprostatin B 6-hydroxylase [Madurella mycetomatis]|uniref:Tryprostatin B 6-hydroxylase n=1 Tax=Madurella mycetomatis TaxID=100816 RepID=A0A175W033_9PEZI|nr:Tryprostatin B 6-hydroxylase [Madurella mycetomatis]